MCILHQARGLFVGSSIYVIADAFPVLWGDGLSVSGLTLNRGLNFVSTSELYVRVELAQLI